MSPETGKPLALCPWLKKLPNQNKYICDIYNQRPDDCKFYPTTIEDMVKLDCEMLEAHDLVNSKQAQKTLDRLMADNRPPLE